MSEPRAPADPPSLWRRGTLSGIRLGFARALVLLPLALAPLPAVAAPAALAPLRFGFSPAAFVGVNETDARAALKVWSQTLGAERGIPVDSEMHIFSGQAEMIYALQHQQVDAVTMMLGEFRAIRRILPLGSLIIGRKDGISTEEYILLVRRDAAATSPADLRGRSINLLEGPRASLANTWLETVLLESKLGTIESFFPKPMQASRLSRVVLPVFFRQADACVVTRSGFRTMTELNPQLGLQLRVLAASPPMVPVVFCFRDDLQSPYREKLVSEMSRIVNSPAGRQTLTLFQSDDLQPGQLSELDSALALLDRHEQLLAERNRPRSGQPPTGSPPSGKEAAP